jgi:glycosyltransferase involved in cell wall biosynthesis
MWRRWRVLGMEPNLFRPNLAQMRPRVRWPRANAGALERVATAPVAGAARLGGAVFIWSWSGLVRLAAFITGRPTLEVASPSGDDVIETAERRPRVLIVSPYSIVPTNHGTAVRLLNLIRELAGRFEIHLLVFSMEGERREERQALEAMGCRVDFYRWTPRAEPRLLATAPRGVEIFRSVKAAAKVLDIVHGRAIELVQLEHAELGQYAKVLPRGVPVALTEHDIVFRTQERRRRHQFHRRFDQAGVFAHSRTEVNRMLRYEVKSCRRVDHVYTMSSSDARYLAPFLFGRASRIRVIPNAVDTSEFRQPDPPPQREGVVFVGNFGHLPNVDALEWFLTDIWPLIRILKPDARLTVVGANATEAVLRYRNVPGVRIEGEVPDTRPYYHSHLVSVAPIRAGSGTRLKILEAFAAGTAVVSTTLGAEGIEAHPGTHLKLADSAVDFARATVRLLTDHGSRERLTTAAAELVRGQYDWAVVADRLAGSWRELLNAAPTRTVPRSTLVVADRGAGDRTDKGTPPEISIVIPTRNGGELLRSTLAAIRAQNTQREFEIICVDSGSPEEDIRHMCEIGARVISIESSTFNHGLTRDLGARHASGSTLVFLNQDAVPAGPEWLDSIVSPLDASTSKTAAVQGHIDEFPGRERRFFWDSCGGRFYFTSESRGWIRDHSGIGFSTVNCAMRMTVWERYPFGWSEILEDKKWQQEVSEAGYSIIYSPEARVLHTHNYGFVKLVRRCFSEGYGWRRLGRRYSVRDLLGDIFRLDIHSELARGLGSGRVRTFAEASFPLARPLALWVGNRFGRRVLH